MENTGTKKLEFYGGIIGAVLPMCLIFIGIMLLVFAGYTSAKTFWCAAVGALMISYLLAKDKDYFGEVVMKGLTNHILAVMILAFLLAGITAELLKDGHLVDGLIWASAQINLGGSFIPALAFITCVIISTCTGTTGGTVSAVTPVMFPVGVALGCHPGLVMGAILSGSFFGDNLAPVSDTTIASAYTQETDVPIVVRSRLKYSIIAGILALIAYIILGFNMTSTAPANLAVNASSAKSLLLLLSPVVLIIAMVRGAGLVSALLACNIFTIVLSLVCGLVKLDTLINPKGVIVAGIESMLFIIVFSICIFAFVEIMNASGVFDKFVNSLAKRVTNVRQAEFLGGIMVCVITLMTAAATASITIVGPVMRKIFKHYHIARDRGANILDGLACGTGGVCFWNLSCLSAYALAVNTGAVGEDFSIAAAMPYSFHCIFLIFVYFFAILTGFGRRFEEVPEEQESSACHE